jgi:hypothetical protein
MRRRKALLWGLVLGLCALVAGSLLWARPDPGKVAVGTRVTPRPPHRSRRAELPHRAPASGDDAKSLFRPGVADAGGREPLGGEPERAKGT